MLGEDEVRQIEGWARGRRWFADRWAKLYQEGRDGIPIFLANFNVDALATEAGAHPRDVERARLAAEAPRLVDEVGRLRGIEAAARRLVESRLLTGALARDLGAALAATDDRARVEEGGRRSDAER
jgi:hypothetical protein